MSDEWSEGAASVTGDGSHSLQCYYADRHHENQTLPIYSYEILSLRLLIFSVSDDGLLRKINASTVITTSVCNTYLLAGSTNA